MTNFEVYKRLSPQSDDPLVTFQRNGQISLNHTSLKVLGTPEYVELLYDLHERIVGIRALKEKAPHAYRATRPIQGRSFFNHYNIPVETTTRFAATKHGDDLLVIDLKLKGVEVTRAPARSS